MAHRRKYSTCNLQAYLILSYITDHLKCYDQHYSPLPQKTYISLLHKENPGYLSFVSSNGLFAVTHLGIDESVINPLLVEELFVCALFHHHTVLKHGDNVSVLDGGQPVSHYDAGTTLTSLIQGLLYDLHRERKLVIFLL